MITPTFFNDVTPIIMRDRLAEVLGAVDKGMIEYTYTDVVKLAGHACPTVAGAYLMLEKGLNALYGDDTPIRGEIKVFVKGTLGEGVVGVISNVASMITGATTIGGFHGLGGHFDRRDLLFFVADMKADMVLERVDTGARAELSYDPSFVAADERMGELLVRIASGSADSDDRELFGTLWQDRVRRILIKFKNDSRLVRCVQQ
ncbi:MAG TPA: hypothetical protein PLM93_00480 [Sulfuricurvum sp.]|nr:MAG: hypothetical protein B7Y30_04270 [Campylobacterales bacterium 16-40-21]OZA03835.1 MAG: hypothetical protein B7X89_03955 [Sulfuricurvum sp. 17-40-25]HQS65646.1 hypothetical protein [Sulfuricurvum sp.]HQT36152.1 hypothetical protein [Sulfuricurvum sp.]